MNPPAPNSIIIITPPPTHSAITVTYDKGLTMAEVLEALQQIIEQLSANSVG